MHSGGSIGSGFLGSKMKGSNAKEGFESTGEGFMGVIARGESNLCYRCRAGLELSRGAFQTQAPDMAHKGLPDHTSKDAVEMVRGETGNGGQFFQREIVVQVVLDVQQNAQH